MIFPTLGVHTGWFTGVALAVVMVSAGCADLAPHPQLLEPLPEEDFTLPQTVAVDEEPLASRAQAIFTKLLEVYPELVGAGLRISPIDPIPLAWASPDRQVILSVGALRYCYRGVDGALGDIRLGFVLSHELAHLAGDHFSHLRMYRAARNLTDDSQEEPALDRALAPPDEKEELQADEQGLVRLALAGYPAGRLVGDSAFFERWGEGTPLSFAGLSPDARTKLLVGTAQQVADRLPYFELGVRLYQLGRYREAQSLLESFERRFSGPAVLNNLGLCRYQLAAQALARCDGRPLMRFMLPTRVASSTLADRLVSRGPVSDCTEAQEFIEHKGQAERYFRKALTQAPRFLPAWLNYTSLMVLAQDGTGALARSYAMEKAGLAPPEAPLLRLLGEYLYGRDSEQVLQGLVKLRASRPDSAPVSYNLARVLLETGNYEAARDQWRHFLNLQLRGPYAEYVAQQIGQNPPAKLRAGGESPSPPHPLGLVNPGTQMWLNEISPPAKLECLDEKLEVYENPRVRAVVRQGRLVLVEQLLEQPIPVDQVLEQFSQPAGRVPGAGGDLLFYEGFGYESSDDFAQRVLFFDFPG